MVDCVSNTAVTKTAIVYMHILHAIEKRLDVKRKESRRVSNRGPSAYQPNALPLGQTGSLGEKVGRGRLYTYRYTVTTRMTSALRWAAMRAILMFQQEVIDKVTRQCPQTTTFLKRKESRSGIEPRSFRLPTYRLTARPSRLTYASLYCWGQKVAHTSCHGVTLFYGSLCLQHCDHQNRHCQYAYSQRHREPPGREQSIR